MLSGSAILRKTSHPDNAANPASSLKHPPGANARYYRSLRKGKYQYIRNYQPYLPDGLQNNYRYKMLAYKQWRELFRAGKLSGPQLQFFQTKPVEALFDVEADPHEVNNLAADPDYADVLVELRTRLQEIVRTLPDLSFQ